LKFPGDRANLTSSLSTASGNAKTLPCSIPPIRPFVECSFESTSHPGMFGVWWGYNNTAQTVITVAAGSASNFLGAFSTSTTHPSTFQPGYHRYAFVSYALGPATWSIGLTTTVLPPSTPRCYDRVVIKPHACLVGPSNTLNETTARFGYTMESAVESEPVVPYLELKAHEHNQVSGARNSRVSWFGSGSAVRTLPCIGTGAY
jgi:hypothetical protein